MDQDLEATERAPVIVGIGASAGGLEALETMFRHMPDATGMAFVIVQHLSPDFKSLMVELMGRHTSMAIHRVEHNMAVAPNSLYLIPPKQDMVIEDGKLLLTERQIAKTPALPIDRFFNSLAAHSGPNSVGIILSGTGSDGSRGIQSIHDAGGLVIVQTPDSAKFNGMPNSAIKSQRFDVTVPPEKIPPLLADFAIHRDRTKVQNDSLPLQESSIERIFRTIQQKRLLDFSEYRITTIGRRIERRIEMHPSVQNLTQYAELLEHDQAEMDHLLNDLLIGVTSFFRDTQPFESLKKQALMELLANHPAKEEFRVWVAACATGEEAYTVAMLIDECLRESGQQLSVKVFATDIHRPAIKKAAQGVYSKDMLQGISEKRLAKYFATVEEGYQVVPSIRRMVVFAPHNLIKDPPFTRLSVITCRNFLIYLTPEAQTKVISHFHFGLMKSGFLLMGSSESPGELASEFEPVDSTNRLYRKIRDVRDGFTTQSELFANGMPGASNYVPLRATRTRLAKQNPLLLTNEEVLSTIVPPGVVIDRSGKVLQVFHNAGKYLQVHDGLLSSNLMDMIDDDLRLAIGGAVQRCTNRREPVCYERLQIKTNDAEVNQVRLTVTPLPKGETPKKFVITFEQLQGEFNKESLATQTRRLALDDISKDHLEDLEEELRHNREILQATNEEMETSNEELQATNEELVASNEELQSSNEELHSVNEELFTVNGEYQRKISELTELTHDFDNLLESTEVHTLFLDHNLRIRKFTPRMAKVLHLVPHDIGRRIDAFVHNINCENLSHNISRVLETGERWEERIRDGSQTEFLMRVLPYRAGTEVSGVVVTLLDISKLAAAQAAVTLERERFERAIRANRDGIWDWPDLAKQEMWWSPTCYQLLGYEPGAFPAVHSEWIQLIHPDDREKIQRTSIPGNNKCYVEIHENFEYRMLHRSGEYRWYCHRAVVDHDETGTAIRMTGSIADIQDRKSFEAMADERIRLRDNFLSMLSHELRNPMGAIMNAITNLRDVNQAAGSSRADQSEISVIARQTKHMARLLDDLLDVARFGRDKIEFRKEIIDLCGLVDTVIESVDYQLQERRQRLQTSICEGPLNIIGDPSRIAQAQTNLIVNASKFSDEDASVSYSLRRQGNEAVITVVDQGAGIAPELLERVFGLFVQSDDTLHRSAGGMGLGLSLTEKIIKAHQGTVTADSKGKDCGSKFEIRLPLTNLIAEKVAAKPVLDHSITCKIMLVEDNADAREMMAKTFQRRGFEVVAVGDGKEAIERFPEHDPRVAVIDIGLPKVSGYDVAKTIRQNQLWDDVLLVALTGYGQKEDAEAIISAGFNHHIVKPLIFSELHELIVAHLSLSLDQN